MAFKLKFRATCECCDKEIKVTGYSYLDANQRISNANWHVINEGKPSEAKHYCPEHLDRAQNYLMNTIKLGA